MKQKNIVFLNIGSNRAIEKVVGRALVSTGSLVSILNSVEQARNYIQQNPIDLALISSDEMDLGTKDFLVELMNRSDSFYTVVLSEKKEKAHLIDLFSHDKLRNLIARNDQVSEQEIIITVEKLLRQDVFGMEKYFTWGIHIIQEPVMDSMEKTDQIKRVGDFVRNLKCDERFVRLAEIVADEMLMNALYDAPVDSEGKHLYAHLPRTERIQLKENEASLQYGSDGRYFGIACRDHFGALQAPTVVKYIRKCFVQDETQIDNKPGGAGVGFFMIFQSISQLVINIDPKKMTETIGLIDIRPMYREVKSRSKSFNIFIKGSGE